MATSDPELRRVAVHAGSGSIDLTLPATMPVGELIPSIVDALGGVTPGARYHLARLGASPLPSSTTLQQNDIRDGTALILSLEAPAPAAVRYDDAAEAVSAAVGRSTQSWHRMTAAVAACCFVAAGIPALIRYAGNTARHTDIAAAMAAAAAVAAVMSAGAIHRICREPIAGLTLGLIATVSAALAGLLAVPGVPGAANVLLAAMAAGATAVLGMRVTRCKTVTLSAAVCCAAIGAVAAVASVVTGAPPHVVGSATALACLGLIEVAPRLSIRLAGLAPYVAPDDGPPRRELTAKALRANGLLTSLRAGFAASAAIGATVAALAAHRAIALAAVTGGVLVLHARTDRARGTVFAGLGIATLATTLVIAGFSLPNQALWIAALASAGAATSIYLGFVAPVVTSSPLARRSVHALACIVLAVVAPVTCWTCGAFGAVRGLNLLRT